MRARVPTVSCGYTIAMPDTYGYRREVDSRRGHSVTASNVEAFKAAGVEATVGSTVEINVRMGRHGVVLSAQSRVDEAAAAATVEVGAFLTLVDAVQDLWTAGCTPIHKVNTLKLVGKSIDTAEDELADLPPLSAPSPPTSAPEQAAPAAAPAGGWKASRSLQLL